MFLNYRTSNKKIIAFARNAFRQEVLFADMQSHIQHLPLARLIILCRTPFLFLCTLNNVNAVLALTDMGIWDRRTYILS